ncbi:cytochrome P450 20A1-like [Branchiostoma floridae]|uniref:Cytochrome P450 20A1-like n=1 Tax=Branchiostoma floridae TaxID=7739 RepID=A0A9J7HUM6_BRAFL|nr:cytochrome P450 20A1-like [Branchiostoma floridae]
MLDYAIFAITFVVFLIATGLYLYPGPNKITTIPGLEPSDPKDGNLGDIGRAGSLHEFLLKLHAEYGDIASFWWGQQLVVSLGAPELWKQHERIFDRPPLLFKGFEPLIGAKSIQYANGLDGRTRRKLYDPSFGHNAMKYYYSIFQELGQEMAQKWESMEGDQHIPLRAHTIDLTMKAITRCSFGDTFKDEECLQFSRNYDICWDDINERTKGNYPVEGSPREKKFQEALGRLHTTIGRVAKYRRENPPPPQEQLFIDLLIEGDLPEEQVLCDAMTYMVGGFHTSGNLLTWALYFIATHKEVEEKLYQELIDVLGKKEDVTPDNISQLVYLRQVLDETLRCAVVGPWGARYMDLDIEIGGHIVPAKTPVIHAFGVVLQDERIWPEPNKFDPERFDAESSKGRHKLAFQPFGFAGGRKCPGYKFSYAETSVFLSILCRQFKLHLVDGQVVTWHGIIMITRPVDEIWITVTKRD